MKKIVLAYLASCLFFSGRCFAVSGFVSPSALTFTFNSVSLTDVDNRNTTLVSSPVTHTFNKTDTDFVGSSLGAVSVPRGRYVSVRVCYNTSRSVKLNGDTYNGVAGSGITNGAALYTTGSDATVNGTVTVTPGTATTLSGLVSGNGTENCSDTTFTTPICVAVAADQASTCQSTDTKLDPTVTAPDLQLMLDMYHCVGIDTANAKVDPHVACYPYATLGRPGAAIHLAYNSGTTYGDIALIFGTDKKLAYTASSSNGSITHFCTGVGAVTATAGPTGAYINSYGPTWVMSFDESTGKVQFATGNCGSGTTCTSSGMLTMNNVLQEQGSSVNVSCPADASATPANLGYTYTTTNTSGTAATTAFTISRIVDPYGLFGKCANGKNGYLSGSTPSGATGGSCGSLP